MKNHFFLFVACFISVEIILKLKFFSYLNLIQLNIKKAIKIMSSHRISDHWKEKIIPFYASKILLSSLSLLGILLLIIIILIGFTLLSDSFLIFILSITGIIESFIFAYFYIKLRAFFK
jgi:hypothetical protein